VLHYLGPVAARYHEDVIHALGADGRSHFRRTPQAGRGGGLSLRGAGPVLRNNVVSGNSPDETVEIP
jgi:hypothetical protein